MLSDKPGVTTRPQLDALTAAVDGRPGRPWTVLFTERFENRAVARAVEMARSGAVGEVVHVIGSGPHSLYATRRPEWFWDPEATGGILVDIGSHQVDQFLSVAGSVAARTARVAAASVGNAACPDHPGMQDVGAMTLTASGIMGDLRVDYLTPAGLGSWGDVRLTIVGTNGTLEARANIDVTGIDGDEHLIHVDADGARRIPVTDTPVDWATRLLADLADGGERLMTQAHVLQVSDLALRAQELAGPWGRP